MEEEDKRGRNLRVKVARSKKEVGGIGWIKWKIIGFNGFITT
jgi:hypothetical protein